VECHGRRLTEDLIGGLEVIPRRVVDYRGSRLEEMELDAILARRPKIALVDELAHTNVPGSGRNAKRWQDVLDILAAGIDVISTVNIQHLESIADEVEHMTGAPVRERVPDWVVRKADQIELVDSSPEQLRRRMLHGNIYPKERASLALINFFRTDNLIALRELALRFLADEADDDLLEHLRRHARAIASFARGNQITQIVIGSSQRSRWQQLTGGGSRVKRIIDEAGALGVDVHVIALRSSRSDSAPEPTRS